MTGPFTALTQAFVHIFNYSGRATRAEFWWVFMFFNLALGVALVADLFALVRLIEIQGQDALISAGPSQYTSPFIALVTFLPMLSLSVRRLHDVGITGFWYFLSVIPIVGWVALHIILMLPSSNSTSVHGTPKLAAATPAGQPAAVDAHKRAMQGYAVLFDKDKATTPEMQAARKAEISDYYRTQVLKTASGA